MTSFGVLAWLVAQPSLRNRLVNGALDDTFTGIYSLSAFDWCVLIPYFAILALLSVFGLHRYETIRRYRKWRSHLLTTAPSKLAQLPAVTVQLPIYNERFVVERLLEATVKLHYPRELLQIQVLDDSTDETHAFTEDLCAEYRARGYSVEYIHRTDRHGFKAGALQEGLATATGSLIAIFDADFLPPTDFLERTVDFFADPQIGVVQTRWTYLNKEFNLLTQVEAMLLDGHFVLEHGSRCGSGLFFNFNGTAGVLRRSMIDDAGGWQHETLTEDSDLSYRAQLRGWRFVYVPDIECPSELPVDTFGFQVQQARWAKGLTQVALKMLKRILRSDLPWRIKAEAVLHLTPNISYPLMLVVSVLMLPVMIIRFYMGVWQMFLFDLPLIIASFWSITAFYLFAQRVLFPKTWWKTIAFIPMLMGAGVGLTLSNSKGVLEALFGVQTSFARTAKYAIGGRKETTRPAAYRRKSGWLPYLEIIAGSYFVYMVDFAFNTMNYFAIPFLLLFVCGYYWAGISTLHEEFRGKLRWERARALAAAKSAI